MKHYLILTWMFVSICSLQAASLRWALTDLSQGYTYQDFHEGIAVCCDSLSKKYGAIDSNGKLVIPAVYDYLSNFNGNCAAVRTQGGYGLINAQGEFVLNPQTNWQIEPLVTDVDCHQQILNNCFLVMDTEQQTQAIFYKDKLITPFTSNHSVEYDIMYPFMRLEDNTYLNLETDEIFSGLLYNMGGYYLSFDENNGVIKAVHKRSYEDVTLLALGSGISGEATAEKACQIKYDNDQWQIQNNKGKVLQSYDVKDGWICDFPFWQCGVTAFQRQLPNGDNQIVIIAMETGKVICDKTVNGKIQIGLYPRLHSVAPTAVMNMKEAAVISKAMWNDLSAQRTFGNIATNNDNLFDQFIELYSIPYVMLAVCNSEYSDKTVQIIDPIMPKKQYVFHLSKGTNYNFGDNLLFYSEDTLKMVYDFIKDKKYSLQRILDYSDNIVLAVDGKEQYFTIEKGKSTTLSKFQRMSLFNDGVAVAESKGIAVLINPQGKILMQDGDDYEIKGLRSSENAILVRNKKTNQLCFAYNPLAKDTLQYNSDSKVKQLYILGEDYFYNRKYNKAMRCFEKIFMHDPKEVNAIIRYADCWHVQRSYATAILYYSKALELDPSNQNVAQNLAVAQEKKRQAEATAAAIQSACQDLYIALDNANQTLISIQEGNQKLTSSANDTSTSSDSGRNSSAIHNNSMSKNADSKTYSDWESQLIRMNTYWETQYNDRDRLYIQSRMRNIRQKWESRGYKMFRSPWEDWDGRKR